MISSIIGAKQSYVLQWGSMLINHQANTPFESISEMMSRMLDPPPKSKLLCTNRFNQSHYLELWSLFVLVKNWEKKKVY